MKKILYKNFTLLICVALFSLSSCQGDGTEESQGLDMQLRTALEDVSLTGSADYFALPKSHELNKIPQDPRNPLTNVKVQLGKKLFFETGLATEPGLPEGEGTYSCASCHVPGSCFQAGVRQGIADGGVGFGIKGEGRIKNPNYDVSQMDIQPIRTPTALHGAYNRTSLWNGQFGAVGPNVGTEANWTVGTPKEKNNLGYEGLETQAIAGLGVHKMGINMDLINNSYYKELFDMAFPEFAASNRYTLETAGLAIAAYERTIIANESPFQYWLDGDYGAITDNQKRGAMLFFGKASCTNCHNGPALNSEEFFALGMNDLEGADIFGDFPDFENVRKGRGGFTLDANDDYKFKTPQIYGLKEMSFYGHGASFTSVRDVIEYKNQAIAENSHVPSSQLAADFRPLGLTDDEIDLLTDFVENALNDDNMMRYVPSSIASGNCFPNNDPMSKDDLGCE